MGKRAGSVINMANRQDEDKNIYRICRKRANNKRGDGSLSSREKAESEFAKRDIPMPATTLKTYESGRTIPPPEVVKDMIRVYGTPELKWMHCSKSCPIGEVIIRADDKIGEDDLKDTYFELAGSFHKVTEIERQLRAIMEDGRISEEEVPLMRDILKVMDRITENTRDLKIWMEREGISIVEE